MRQPDRESRKGNHTAQISDENCCLYNTHEEVKVSPINYFQSQFSTGNPNGIEECLYMQWRLV
jgi:hypothetical protein